MQGRQVIEIIIKDVEDFFDGTYIIEYAIEPRKSACQKIGEGARIVITSDISDFAVVDLSGLLMVLLEVCHEVAHYLNCHAVYVSRDEELKEKEDRSLEVWADFFGAKLIMTLILLGNRVRPLAKSLGYTGLKSLLDALNEALLAFYASRYKESDASPIYEKKDSRVGLCVAGINSVLDRAGGINYQRSLAVFMGLHRGTDVMEKCAPDKNYMQDHHSIHVGIDIMKNLQKGGKTLFEGMDEFVAYILGAGNYDISKAERDKYVDNRRRRFLAAGVKFE